MNNPLTTLNRLMSRVKRALGLPDSTSVLGLIRMCPILALLSLLPSAFFSLTPSQGTPRVPPALTYCFHSLA